MSRRSTLAPLGSRWSFRAPLSPAQTMAWGPGSAGVWSTLPVEHRSRMEVGGVVVLGYGKRGTVILRETWSGGKPLPPIPLSFFMANATPMGPYGGTRPSGNGVSPTTRRRRARLSRSR